MSTRKDEIPSRWTPTDAMTRAFEIAREFHKKDTRKGTDIPYISHLMAVSALVTEHGGSETQAAAALLHDTLEDTAITFESLSAQMGTEVAQIVRDCSDTEKQPGQDKEPWEIRKAHYLEKLDAKSIGDPSLLVALADKVHNIETTLTDTRAMSHAERVAYFGKFNAGWDKQHGWYSALVDAFTAKVTEPEALPLVKRLTEARNQIFSTGPTKGDK